MPQHDEHAPLQELDERLRRRREQEAKKRSGPTRGADPRSGLGLAMRIGVELVAALLVGVGIGWLLDQWLGTTPWLMLVFFLLGSASGMFNVYRVMTGMGHAVGYKSGTSGAKETGPDEKSE